MDVIVEFIVMDALFCTLYIEL